MKITTIDANGKQSDENDHSADNEQQENHISLPPLSKSEACFRKVKSDANSIFITGPNADELAHLYNNPPPIDKISTSSSTSIESIPSTNCTSEVQHDPQNPLNSHPSNAPDTQNSNMATNTVQSSNDQLPSSYPSAPNPDLMQYSSNTSFNSLPSTIPNTQPINTMQPTTPPQPTTTTVTQPFNQNTVTFHQNQLHNERHQHQYIPIVLDDAIGCVTYIAKMTVDANQRLAMSDYTKLSNELRNSSKKDSTDIAQLYIGSVVDYGSMICLEIQYMQGIKGRQQKRVYVSKSDCTQNRLCKVLESNGISCFNNSISKTKISSYLYQLIQCKMPNEKHDLPQRCGFSEIDGEWHFVTSEYCKKMNYPSVTSHSFEVEDINPDLTSEQAEDYFVCYTECCHNSKQFLLLNILRILGLLSTPLDSLCSIRFNKIVFLHGYGEKISQFLQVYDRGTYAARPESINVPIIDLEDCFYDQKDCVIILEDKANTSDYKKKNGVNAIEYLSGMLYDSVHSSYLDFRYITVVFSERLSQMMPSEKALVIDYSDFTAPTVEPYNELLAMTYYLDRLIIKRVCSDPSDFQKCTLQNQEKYKSIANQNGVDPVTFTCMMLAYHEMIKQFRTLNQLMSEEQMGEYLVEILSNSDKCYNGGSVSKEFRNYSEPLCIYI